MKHVFLCTRLTGISLVIFFASSCRTTKHSSVPFAAYIEGIKVVKPSHATMASHFIGPPSPIMDEQPLINKKKTNIIEKGGSMTYVPPARFTKKPEVGIEVYDESELLEQAVSLRKYAIENNYDTKYAFLVNMSMKSGKKRFYVVNLETMTIENNGLVAHGRGEEGFTFDRDFSNAPGSNCTSLGRYKIGKSYTGSFGLAFKLYGLDNTNSNAYKRFVVLHGMGCISYDESSTPICQSEGCPAVSPKFLEEIKPLIDSREKPMLLWVFASEKKLIPRK